MNGHGQGRGRGRPTLEDVALRAGVGRGTVSRVVNGSPKVSGRTRAAVEAAVAELGYVPDRAARALAAGRAGAVALVLPGPQSPCLAEPGFSGVLRGAAETLAGAGVQLVLILGGGVPRPAGPRVDGVLLLSPQPGDPPPGVPAVAGGPGAAAGTLPSVDCDHLGGAAGAVRHLLGRGRREIAAIAGPPQEYGARRRLEGYRQALAAAGHPADERLVAVGDLTEDGGRRAMRELLERRPALDAVFAASDLLAAGALRELRAAGRRVPQDVAVVGFGDSEPARYLDPPLTSVRAPAEELGRTMARLLLARISGGGTEEAEIVLPTELIVRGST
ncbi:LacI family DNA-binding transcriptional regulator [Streptomyces sp. NBC_00091]|uniref:LacI family DNA-binding transcriptional regulator n=1 Tax=Streptomyces sp. NBC_00091 TaxID=2975648 RepID=UPI00225A16FF|nr:LacI family DNA-binding transcriptional regulator [Streptomyces sp. NBC_00091]MCX5378229.1 LacI family transcriptional regulator [Streptomyces sp. NBC_00091]